MRQNLIVSERGQITLPAALRKRFSIKPGGLVILEERNGEIVLKPAAVVELETYSAEDVAAWQEEDVLTEEERRKLRNGLGSNLPNGREAGSRGFKDGRP